MKKRIALQLQAISPIIDYEKFYSNYHKRKNPFLLLKEKEKDLPQIKKDSNSNFISIDNNDNKTNNKYNTPKLTPLRSNKITNSTFFPKIDAMPKNLKFQLKNKTEKKEGKLSIKYIDLINMNQTNKLLIYEITKASKLEQEITKYIFDPISKSKILQKLDIIDKKANEDIKDIMNNTTRKEKEEALQFFVTNPKIINTYAEDIFKIFNNKKEKINNDNKNDKMEEKKDKIGMTNIFEAKRYCIDFLECAKKNIIRKIDLRNQCNQEITIEYIEMLLKNEVEKIKIIISIYLDENQNENILFNPGEHSALTGNIKEKYKKVKNLKALGKSINKLIHLNNYYKSFLQNNSDEEKYRITKLTKNEKTQYNYTDFFNNEFNDKINTRNEYINKTLNQFENDEQNKYNDFSKKNDIFSRFQKFNKNKKNESIEKDLNEIKKEEKAYINENETINEMMKRKSIPINKKETEENKKGNEKGENEPKNYKIIEENEKIISMNNKDILSIFGRTKYNNNNNNDIIKENGRYEPNNNEDKMNNISEENINNDKGINQEINNDDNNNNHNDDCNKNDISESNETLNEHEVFNILGKEEYEEENKTKEDFILNKLTTNNNINDNNNLNDNNNINDYNNINYNKNESNIDIIFTNYKEIEKNIDSLNIPNSENEKKEQPKKKSKYKNNINKTSQIKTQTKSQTQSKTPAKMIIKKSPEKLDNSKSNVTSTSIKKDNNTNNKQNNIINNNKVRNSYQIKELIINNKITKDNNNKNKSTNISRKSKIIQSQIKKIFPKGNRKSIFNLEKPKKFLIKDFHVLNQSEKKIKRNLSFNYSSKLEEEKNKNINEDQPEVNIITLQQDDIDQIVNFINEEEKRKKRTEKNNNKNLNGLTREDLIEKLKNDDFKARQYIEKIIRAGLAMGNKQLNKQMKNSSILIFQGSNLGVFKFKKNFGIKEEVNIETFRHLSHNKKQKEEKKENKEKEQNIKNYKEKNNREKKEKEKEKEKKKEEAKKNLIYDNSYLFAKRRQSIKYILRKEVEEILKGGILLQQKAIDEEEKIEEIQNRFIPPKRPKFIKKKKNRGKLFRKSVFLKDINNQNITPIRESSSSSSSTSEIKEEPKKSFEEKMQYFIDRIKKFKKGDEINMNEIDELISQRFKRDEKEKEKEIRIKGFLHKLNEYRDINKIRRKKHNNFSYKEPINIMTNSGKDINII